MTVERSLERLRPSLGGLEPSERHVLLEEARTRARERVLSLLVDELTELMLGQVHEELTPNGQARPRRKRQSAEPTEKTSPVPLPPDGQELGWYVYGVIAAQETDQPASLPGVNPSHGTTTLQQGGLAAVVSRVPLADFDEEPLRERLTDMEWLERTARAHEEVLELIGRQRTLIPMRICSIYRDQGGVEEMLRREADALHKGLKYLQGRTEWGVKVFAHRAAMARPAGSDSDLVAEGQPAEGTAYLRRRQEEHQLLERADQELEDACQEIHTRLEALSAGALASPVQRPEVAGHPGEMILNGSYLVGDDDYDEFVAEIDRLRDRFQALELVLTGPWPAYNFVPGAIGAAW